MKTFDQEPATIHLGPSLLAQAASAMEMTDAGAYALFAAAGGTAGFARFLRSTRAWKWRVVCGFALFGAIASVAFIGLTFGSDVHANIWKPIGYSLAIGFGQPEFASEIVQALLKACGIRIQMESKS